MLCLVRESWLSYMEVNRTRKTQWKPFSINLWSCILWDDQLRFIVCANPISGLSPFVTIRHHGLNTRGDSQQKLRPAARY